MQLGGAQGASNHPEALQTMYRALALYEELGDLHGLVLAHFYVGLRSMVVGQCELFEQHVHLGSELAASLKDRHLQGRMLVQQSWLAYFEKHYAEAEKWAEEALTIFTPNAALMAMCQITLASIAALHKDERRARTVGIAGLRNAGYHGGVVGPLMMLPVFAWLRMQSEQPETAVELLALSSTHPARAKCWQERSALNATLEQALRQRLDDERFANDWKRGTELKLVEVAASLLQTWSIS